MTVRLLLIELRQEEEVLKPTHKKSMPNKQQCKHRCSTHIYKCIIEKLTIQNGNALQYKHRVQARTSKYTQRVTAHTEASNIQNYKHTRDWRLL